MKRKNKREEQALKREALKVARRKNRSLIPSLARAKPAILEKKQILIVCEGKNTEPQYFKKFRLSSAKIVAVGEGYNTTSLVQRASKLSEQDEYDQVWCVFDKDDFPSQNFNNAVYMAEGMGFKVAYSNQAFEYWFILHFEDHQGGAMHRDDYCTKLNKYLGNFGVYYDCDSKGVTDELFTVLCSKIVGDESGATLLDLACRRAGRNVKYHADKSPAEAESSTKVYELVRELLKYL